MPPATKPKKPKVRTATGRGKTGSSRGNVIASALQQKEALDGVNPHVAPRGYATDGSDEHNIQTYGYICPRDHFITGPRDITAYRIAIEWGLRIDTVARWRKDDKWDELKKAWLDKHPAEAGGNLVSTDLAALQQQVVEKHLEIFDEMLDTAITRFRETEEEQVTPTGDVVKIQKKEASNKAATANVLEIMEAQRIAVGLHVKPVGALAGANVTYNDNRIIEVQEIVERRPPPEQTDDYKQKMRLELMAPDDNDKVAAVEGEVTEPGQ